MASLPGSLQPHTVTVRTKTGTTGTGTKYADPVTVQCFVDDKARLVRDSTGAQVVSSSTVYTSDTRNLWAPGSTVVVNGRPTTVLQVAVHDDAGLGGWHHTEIALV